MNYNSLRLDYLILSLSLSHTLSFYTFHVCYHKFPDFLREHSKSLLRTEQRFGSSLYICVILEFIWVGFAGGSLVIWIDTISMLTEITAIMKTTSITMHGFPPPHLPPPLSPVTLPSKGRTRKMLTRKLFESNEFAGWHS